MITRNWIEFIIFLLLTITSMGIKLYTRKKVSYLDGAEGIYIKEEVTGHIIGKN